MRSDESLADRAAFFHAARLGLTRSQRFVAEVVFDAGRGLWNLFAHRFFRLGLLIFRRRAHEQSMSSLHAIVNAGSSAWPGRSL